MEQKKYPLSVLERLCDDEIPGKRVPWHVLRDDGLWLKPRERLSSPSVERDVMEWHPKQDSTLTALSVPFTARELAAFMLAGGGLFLLEPFEGEPEDCWPPSLDEAALDRLGPNEGQAREAMREAHRLLRLATERFGRDDAGVLSAAGWLLSGDDAGQVTEPAASTATLTEAGGAPPTDVQTQDERRKHRYQACIDAGLRLPNDDYARLPRGIAVVAKRMGITRQALAEDVKAHIRSTMEK